MFLLTDIESAPQEIVVRTYYHTMHILQNGGIEVKEKAGKNKDRRVD